jgi:hypothetical protein
MEPLMLRRIGLLTIACCTGCAGVGNFAANDRTGAYGSRTAVAENATESHMRSTVEVTSGVSSSSAQEIEPTHQPVAYETELVDPVAPSAAPADAQVIDQVRLPPPGVLDNSVVELNLPTALSMVGGQHPAVGFARWQVQEAYAQYDQARVLWLPTIQSGFSFHRHDGNYQASDGSIVEVNRNSF